MNKFLLSFLAGFLVAQFGALLPQTAHAMVVRGGDTFELETYTTLEDDLYVAGKTLSFAGTTTGDIFAVGSQVTQSGYVSEDALLAGGNVFISGDVEGDLRVVGGKILFSGHVTEDLVLIGGTIIISEDAVIDGDVLILGDYFSSKGTVQGVAEVYVRTAEFTGGTVGGSLHVLTRESLAITGETHIFGDLELRAPKPAFISETASIEGETMYIQTQSVGEKKGNVDLIRLIELVLITVVFAIALVFFFPNQTRVMTDIALQKGSSFQFLKGFLILFSVPIILLIFALTLVGILPALTLLFVYIVLVFVGMALAPILGGVLLARWFKKGDEELSFAWVSFGAIMFTLISLLPYIGFLVRLMIFLVAFYAGCEVLYQGVWKQRKGTYTVIEKKIQHDNKQEKNAQEEGDTKKA